jgi:hypothetical protein
MKERNPGKAIPLMSATSLDYLYFILVDVHLFQGPGKAHMPPKQMLQHIEWFISSSFNVAIIVDFVTGCPVCSPSNPQLPESDLCQQNMVPVKQEMDEKPYIPSNHGQTYNPEVPDEKPSRESSENCIVNVISVASPQRDTSRCYPIDIVIRRERIIRRLARCERKIYEMTYRQRQDAKFNQTPDEPKLPSDPPAAQVISGQVGQDATEAERGGELQIAFNIESILIPKDDVAITFSPAAHFCPSHSNPSHDARNTLCKGGRTTMYQS